MSFTGALSRFVLVLVNIVFFIIGLVFAVCGGIVKWAPHIYTKYIKNILKDHISDTDINAIDIEKFTDQLFSFLSTISFAIFIIGLVFIAISLLAMCGVCCTSTCFITTYAVIIGIVAAGVIAFTIVLFVKPHLIEDAGAKALKKFVQDKYKGPSNLSELRKLNGMSGFLDLIQITFKCCGVTNYTEFYRATGWKRNFKLNVDGTAITYKNLKIPISCCKITLPNTDTEQLRFCLTKPNPYNSNMHRPCYTKLWEYIQIYWKYVQYGFVGCSVFLVLMVIVAYLATRLDKERVDPL